MAAEVGRLGHGSELPGLEAIKAEGMQAGKGAGVIEGFVAHRTLGQLVDCGKGQAQQRKKRRRRRCEHVSQRENSQRRIRGHTRKGFLPGSEGGDKGIILFLDWARWESWSRGWFGSRQRSDHSGGGQSPESRRKEKK